MHTHTHPHTYPHPDAVIVLFPSCLSALIPPDHDMPLDQMLLWQHTHREEKNIIRHYKTSGLIHNWMDKRLWISKSSSDGRGSWWVGQGNNEAKTLETLELSLCPVDCCYCCCYAFPVDHPKKTECHWSDGHRLIPMWIKWRVEKEIGELQMVVLPTKYSYLLGKTEIL